MFGRLLASRLESALRDTPVVLIHGARQVGKTTLAGMVGGERKSLTLDRASLLAAAETDPEGFIDGLDGPVFIDEIQRSPKLFPAIKRVVDEDRAPGRFLLSGSANVLSLPSLSESLAGRMEVCTLWPLTQAEIEQEGAAAPNANTVDWMFGPQRPPEPDADDRSVLERLLRGGFPEVVTRRDPERRQAWFESYITTILQRDIRELGNIDRLAEMPRLLQLLAARSSGLLSYTDLASGLTISQSTVKRYIAMLEATFLVYLLPAWTANLSGRVIKSPKSHMIDSGLAAALVGADADRLQADGALRGQLLESFVVIELVKLAGVSRVRAKPHHYRTTTGREVDCVLEAPDGRVVGVEVKSAASVGASDFRGIDALREVSGDRFHRGLVFYGGGEVVPFGDQRWAVPHSVLWNASA